jgi:hypothetical protein
MINGDSWEWLEGVLGEVAKSVRGAVRGLDTAGWASDAGRTLDDRVRQRKQEIAGLRQFVGAAEMQGHVPRGTTSGFEAVTRLGVLELAAQERLASWLKDLTAPLKGEE